MILEEQESRLGFAISSPIFFLSGGDRTITIKLNFTDNSFGFKKTTESHEDNISGDFLVSEIFSDVFSISITGEKDWFQINPSALTYLIDSDHSILIITLLLDSTEQGIFGYDAKTHGLSYTTHYPILNFTIQNNLSGYAYNFINNLEIIKASVISTVKGFKNLSLYNQYGQIDASKPFQPLGMQPDKGSYLLIGSKEIFAKNSDEIEIIIEWQTLPATGGFNSYYEAYNISPPIENNSFQVTTSVLTNSKWVTPQNFDPCFDLFNTVFIEENKNKTSSLLLGSLANIIDPSLLPPIPDTPLKFEQNTQGSFIKFELTAPSCGFGANMYGNILTNTILENSKNPAENNSAKLLPLPNFPFTPVAKGISLNYRATATIDLISESNRLNNLFLIVV